MVSSSVGQEPTVCPFLNLGLRKRKRKTSGLQLVQLEMALRLYLKGSTVALGTSKRFIIFYLLELVVGRTEGSGGRREWKTRRGLFGFSYSNFFNRLLNTC